MKPDTQKEIKELFSLYLNQQTTPEQEALLFSFINTHEDSETYFKEIITEVWNKDIERNNKLAHNIPSKKLKTYSWLKYAASLVIICTAALSFYTLKSNQSHTINIITRTTLQGEKIKLLLPDSSIVYLNALSKLSFPAHFEPDKTREIQLEGEAFFEVKHDSSRPFIVRSGQMQTRVLGTSFNINAYPDNQTFNVSVRTGKVGVSVLSKNARNTLSLLSPGQHLVYHLANKKYLIEEQRAGDFNSWTSNRFIFKNETLANIIGSLKRSYLIDFKVSNAKILSCRFTATFANKNIKEIAAQLQTMSGGSIHYKFNPDNTIITLWGEACQ